MEVIAFLLVKLQPITKFQGQATDIELARKEVKNVMAELVSLSTIVFHV